MGYLKKAFIVVAICLLQIASIRCYTLKKMLDTVNDKRASPSTCITSIVNNYRSKTDSGSRIHSVWQNTFVEECPAVFDDAISFLEPFVGRDQPSTLTLELGLCKVMYDFLKGVAAENGGVSQSNSVFHNLANRVSELAPSYTSTGIYSLGINSITAKTEDDLINDWIIDDGNGYRKNRDFMTDLEKTKIGIGLYTSGTKTYYGMIMLQPSFSCTECTSITCAMKEEMGWNRYLVDIGQPAPSCSPPTSPGETGNTPSTNNSPTTPTSGTGNSSQQTPTSNYSVIVLRTSFLVEVLPHVFISVLAIYFIFK